MPDEVTVQAEETQQSALEQSEVDETKTSEADSETAQSESEQPKHKGGFQKRIDRLTKRNYELESKLERQSEQVQTLLDRLEGKTSVAKEETDKPTPKPVFTLDGFNTYDEAIADFTEKLTDWKAEQKVNAALEKARTSDSQKTEQQRQKEAVESYKRHESEARARYEDYDEVVNSSTVKIHDACNIALVELDNGPDVVYHLAKNPALAEQLLKMSPYKAVAEIGKIAAALAKTAPVVEETDEAEPSPQPKPEVSKAPPPIKPVSKPAPTARVDLNDPNVPIEKWLKARNEQLKRR